MEWVPLPCANVPPRNSHASVLVGETMVIIGGASPEGQTNDVFTIDLSTRSNLTCHRVSCQSFEPGTDEEAHSDGVVEVPASREMHSACVFDSKGTEGARATTVLLMGGRSATGVLRDLFSLDTGIACGVRHEKMSKRRKVRPTADTCVRQAVPMGTVRFKIACTAVACAVIPLNNNGPFSCTLIIRRFLDLEAIERCSGYSLRTFILFHGDGRSDGHIRWMGWVSSWDSAALPPTSGRLALRSCSFSGVYLQVPIVYIRFARFSLCARNRGQTVAGDLHLFDVRCGEWTTPRISPRTIGRFAHAACAVMGRERLLVFGGVNPGEDLDDVVELTKASS